jgi:hypothetical protein
VPVGFSGLDLAAPTLFTAYINGVPTKMVGVVNKNVIYYALNASKISSGAVWEDQLGPGSDCPECGTALLLYRQQLHLGFLGSALSNVNYVGSSSQ